MFEKLEPRELDRVVIEEQRVQRGQRAPRGSKASKPRGSEGFRRRERGEVRVTVADEKNRVRGTMVCRRKNREKGEE